MTETTKTLPKQHARTGPAEVQLPEPSHAERVRTLLALGTTGTLCTISRRLEGFPFGSLMPYALDSQGRPLLLVSSMAMHTQNLKAEPRASLFVAQALEAGGDVLGAARATLVGRVEALPANELAEARAVYLATHANSRYWVDFADFSFFRLEPMEIYYVGGFGVMGWVAAEAYREAEPDPLAQAAAGILQHMNADHEDSMLLLARVHAGVQASKAAMTSVDRLGFWLRLETGDGVKGVRVNFSRGVQNARQTREVLVEMVRAAEPTGHGETAR